MSRFYFFAHFTQLKSSIIPTYRGPQPDAQSTILSFPLREIAHKPCYWKKALHSHPRVTLVVRVSLRQVKHLFSFT